MVKNIIEIKKIKFIFFVITLFFNLLEVRVHARESECIKIDSNDINLFCSKFSKLRNSTLCDESDKLKITTFSNQLYSEKKDLVSLIDKKEKISFEVFQTYVQKTLCMEQLTGFGHYFEDLYDLKLALNTRYQADAKLKDQFKEMYAKIINSLSREDQDRIVKAFQDIERVQIEGDF